MTKSLKLAFAAVLTVALVAPAMAQSNFPDVPDNHWAYEALGKMMKEGILVGYPDGLFRGPRPASRYEMAVAINAAYQKLAGMDKGLSEKIDELQKAIDNKPTGGTVDLSEIKAQLEELKAGLAGMKGYGDDIAALKKMAQTFEKELASLGVDVEGMKKDLDELKKRVDNMPKPAVAFSGDVNLLVLAGNSRDNSFAFTPSGLLFGVGRGSYADVPVGMTRDLSVLHEMGLTLQGTNEEGPKWHATLVAGNMLSSFGNMTNALLGDIHEGYGTSVSDTGNTDIYFHTFGVSFDTSLVGQGFSAEIGRLGFQVGPYLFQRPAYLDFYKNDRWDNGDYLVDGGLLKFKFGAVGVDLVAGRMSNQSTTNGNQITPLGYGETEVDQMLGTVINVPLGDKGNLKAAYLMLETNNPSSIDTQDIANRLNQYGVELNYNLGPIKFNGNYAKSDYSYNTTNIRNSDNDAWDVKLGYDTEKWGIGGGYREIKKFFAPVGDWGRIGSAWNPTNIKSFYGNLWFAPTETIKLYAKGEFAKPKDEDYSMTGPVPHSFYADDLDKVDSMTFGLDYKLNANWNLGLSYEDVKWTMFSAPNMQERWYNINLAYAMGPNATLSLGYMLCDNDYTWDEGGIYKGGLFHTQVSVKF